MNFSEQTDEFIQPFLKSFGKCDKKLFSKEENNAFKTILISLYNDIYDADKTIFKTGCFKSQLIRQPHIKRPDNYNSTRYFPEEIKTYIAANEKGQLLFTCGNVGGREINIYFTLFDNTLSELVNSDVEKYTKYVEMMYRWLHICGKYATKNCTKNLTIFVYLTPFAKNLPANTTTTLGPEHVNTAFTMACIPNGQLILFREEEWFKVFIHETFHTYGLDFSQSNIAELKKTLISLFPIKSDFDIYEAYTETWARLINCALCSFEALEKKNKKNKKVFLENILFCLEMERMFALYQCVKVLGFMGMEYTDLYEPSSHTLRTQLYRENTHVFSYYVLTAIFLNDTQGFLIWCKKHNEVLLRFNPTDTNFTDFGDYIKSIYNCIPLQNGIKYMNQLIKQINKSTKKKLMHTTRMSIIHTI